MAAPSQDAVVTGLGVPVPLTQSASDARVDQLNQFLQFAYVRRLYALKSGWSVVSIYIDAIQE